MRGSLFEVDGFYFCDDLHVYYRTRSGVSTCAGQWRAVDGKVHKCLFGRLASEMGEDVQKAYKDYLERETRAATYQAFKASTRERDVPNAE